MCCDQVLLDLDLADVLGAAEVSVHADLAAIPASARRARLIVGAALTDDGSDFADGVVWTAQLLASELVANGIMHARTHMHLGVVHDERMVLIAVNDGGRELPRATLPRNFDFEEAGRGMTIVASLADDFGWHENDHDTGKTTWALLTLDASSPG